MSLSPLIPFAGLALGSAAVGSVRELAAGASDFLSALRGDAEVVESSTDTDPQPSSAELLERFRKRLTDKLAAFGIDISQPLVLKPDGRGGIYADENHPECSRIEQLMSLDPQLTADFQEIASRIGYDGDWPQFGLRISGQAIDVVEAP